MVLVYMLTWLGYIDGIHVTIYSSTMDPSWVCNIKNWLVNKLRTGFPYLIIIPIGSMYAIYGNIYHQYTPNVIIYIPYMDPMGYET